MLPVQTARGNLKEAKMNLKTRIKLELGSWKDKTMWLSVLIAVMGANLCLFVVELFFRQTLPRWFFLTFMGIYSLIIYMKMYIYFESMKKQPKSLNTSLI